MNESIPIITIDGPSGVGKGTVSKQLACILGWNLLDSGVIYRILAAQALSKHINLDNEEKLIALIFDMKVSFIKIKNNFFILYNNKIINKNIIYTEHIGNVASRIAMLPKIRTILLKYQRKYCVLPGLVADGRDMGTIVFPNAEIKFYLYASFQERQRRRLIQLQKIDFNVNFKLLKSQIKERNDRDDTRKIAPITPADDALILNSTYLSEKEIIHRMWIYIRNKKINIKI